jgi:hypothetical protein
MIELTVNRGYPKRWTLCFDPSPATPLLKYLIPGRFKHVRAFGYVPLDGVWVFVDWTLKGMVIRAAPDQSQTADNLIRAWIDGCDLVQVDNGSRMRALPGFYCVGAMKRLTGVPSGALLPDGLWRDCLKFGGKSLDEDQRTITAPATASTA